MTYKAKLAVFFALFVWASAFVAIREGLTSYSPGALGFLRFIVASLCMVVIYSGIPREKRVKLNFKDVVLMLVSGMIGVGVYNLTLNYGEVGISSGMASFIISQSPILTAIFAVMFLGERMNWVTIAGFVISVVGVALISYGEVGGFTWNNSLTYIIIATIASGFYTISQKPFVDRYHMFQVTSFYIWGGTLFLMIYMPELRHDIIHASWHDTLLVIYLGIFPGAFGMMAWSYVLKQVPASRAGSFLYYMPFMATLLGWVLLGEIPALLSVTGGLMAIGGVWFVNHSYRMSSSLISFTPAVETDE